MKVVDTTQIYSFAPIAAQNDFAVSPSEQLVTLTYGQLQELITQAVTKATQPLVDRISSLEATIAHLQEENAALEATQATLSDNQLIQLRLIGQLREAIKKEPEEDSPLIDELYKEMKAMGRKQTDFATAARMVKRSKARLFQLKPAIALDSRFVLIPSESHSQKILIRLREFYKTV